MVMSDAAREVITILLTAAGSSGFAAAWFNRRSRQERASVTDKLKAEITALLMTTFRTELEAEQQDAAERRGLIDAQESELREQAVTIREQGEIISAHEQTILQFTLWAEWVGKILRERGIPVPPPPRRPDQAADSVHAVSLLSELASGND